jgi:NitT/TauT family transport system ATP-binding protein
MAMQTPAVESRDLLVLTDVSKSYGAGPQIYCAVTDVTLTIREGEFVSLLGPSGCGKSTLLRIITGLNRATSGTVLYRGEPVVEVNPHATIVFQTFALYPWLTVEENVEVALKAAGAGGDRRAPGTPSTSSASMLSRPPARAVGRDARRPASRAVAVEPGCLPRRAAPAPSTLRRGAAWRLAELSASPRRPAKAISW